MPDPGRLGKPGAYRLGRMSAPGPGAPRRPVPLRPSFARPQHRGPVAAWVAAWLAGVLLLIGGAAAGLWFAPFVVGGLAGFASRAGGWRLRVAVPAVVLLAVAGWGIPLWWPALRGQPAGATARAIAALAGLPASAAAGFGVTVLVAVLQALVGCWLGRAFAPRPPAA
ncbi:MAG: hypothetical protein ACLQDY_07335 [Streptosporangiaceae bacterium]